MKCNTIQTITIFYILFFINKSSRSPNHLNNLARRTLLFNKKSKVYKRPPNYLNKSNIHIILTSHTLIPTILPPNKHFSKYFNNSD